MKNEHELASVWLTENTVTKAINAAAASIATIIEKDSVLCVHVPVEGNPGFSCQIDFHHARKSQTYATGEYITETAYLAIATQKAMQALCYGYDTRDIRTNSPVLVQPLTFAFVGGVYLDGIACGVSGLHNRLDQLFAEIFCSTVTAIVGKRLDEQDADFAKQDRDILRRFYTV
jgi:hypothetical protein